MQVLVVCTANIARSPLAAAMLARELGPEVSVISAGTRGRLGSTAAPESVQLAELRGLDLRGHRSQPVTAELVAASDLVVTMSERQRDAVAQLAARMAGRVFTLRELTRLMEAVDAASSPTGSVPERLVWWRDEAHLARPMTTRPRGAEDVADPIGRPWPEWEVLGRLFDQLLPALGHRVRP